MNKYYVAYGSNLNLEQMKRRCPTAKVVGTCHLTGYQLLFQRVATIVPRPGTEVPVAIWEIDDACEQALDRYEGFPYLYRKEYLPVTVNGETVDAMVYIMNTGAPQQPPRSYLNTILQGYIDCSLDTHFLEEALIYTDTL